MTKDFEENATDAILIAGIISVFKVIEEEKNLPHGHLQHAIALSTYLGIGDDVTIEGDFQEDCELDGWIDAVTYLIEEDMIKELKELIVECLIEVDRFEVITELKKIEVL